MTSSLHWNPLTMARKSKRNLLIAVILIVFNQSNCQELITTSMYIDCDKVNHFCFGSKGTESKPSSNPAIGNEGCIKEKYCYVIVHGIRSDDGSKVTWYIGSEENNWIYVGFSKGPWVILKNGTPQKVPVMEVWDSFVSDLID